MLDAKRTAVTTDHPKTSRNVHQALAILTLLCLSGISIAKIMNTPLTTELSELKKGCAPLVMNTLDLDNTAQIRASALIEMRGGKYRVMITDQNKNRGHQISMHAIIHDQPYWNGTCFKTRQGFKIASGQLNPNFDPLARADQAPTINLEAEQPSDTETDQEDSSVESQAKEVQELRPPEHVLIPKAPEQAQEYKAVNPPETPSPAQKLSGQEMATPAPTQEAQPSAQKPLAPTTSPAPVINSAPEEQAQLGKSGQPPRAETAPSEDQLAQSESIVQSFSEHIPGAEQATPHEVPEGYSSTLRIDIAPENSAEESVAPVAPEQTSTVPGSAPTEANAGLSSDPGTPASEGAQTIQNPPQEHGPQTSGSKAGQTTSSAPSAQITDQPSEAPSVPTTPENTVAEEGKESEPMPPLKNKVAVVRSGTLARSSVSYNGEHANTRKIVAISFDDGPWNNQTRRVLEIAAREKVPLTFYVIGRQVAGQEKIMKEIVSQGHEIGNHSWSHPTYKVSSAVAKAEIEKTNAAILRATGIQAPTFRPPGGHLETGLAATAAQSGQRVVAWSSTGDDWKPGTSPATIVRNAMKTVRPGGIILLHDGGGNRSATVVAFSLLIKKLRDQGYSFVTVSQLLAEQERK